MKLRTFFKLLPATMLAALGGCLPLRFGVSSKSKVQSPEQRIAICGDGEHLFLGIDPAGAGGEFTVAKWVHVTATRKGGETRVFIDGKEIGRAEKLWICEKGEAVQRTVFMVTGSA